jgi:RNA polymerase sigma factor (sigma-70 family)
MAQIRRRPRADAELHWGTRCLSTWHPKPHIDDPAVPEGSDDSQDQVIERLFREHNEALVRFLRARLRSYQEARDVAQEAYVRLLSLDKPGAVSYLRTFLFRTAANIAIDRRRRAEVHRRVTDLPLFHEFADKLTPERRAAGEETLQRLERLVAALPPRCQQAFVLSQRDGLNTVQIARAMNVSESMARRYVMRALLHCRTRLDLTEGVKE